MTYHCRIDIKSGKIIGQFTTDEPCPTGPDNRVWHRDYGYVEARAGSKEAAKTLAIQMREQCLST